jgi:hypothetical protein
VKRCRPALGVDCRGQQLQYTVVGVWGKALHMPLPDYATQRVSVAGKWAGLLGAAAAIL